MTRSRIIWAVVAVAAVGSMAPGALAVDPPDLFPAQLHDFIWTGNGDGTTWQSATNWTPPNIDFAGQYPDDPNRLDNDGDENIDTDLITLTPVEGANFSVPRATDLTVNIASGNVTVAAIKLGGTTSAVTTNINATAPHRLVLELAERNDTSVETVTNYTYNQGTALIWSTGTDGVGKVNRINADVQLNDDVDVEGDRDLHIYGNIYEGTIDRNTGDAIQETLASSINNLLSNGKKLYIHGNLNISSGDGDPVAGGVQERRFAINRHRGTLEANPAPDPLPEPVARWGTVDISGQIIGDGYLEIGPGDAGNPNLTPLSTVILRADSSLFTGRLVQGRANIALGHDNALGDADIVTGNPNQGFGFNFIPVNGDRVIDAPVSIAQWQTVKAASAVPGLEEFSDHSITFTGEVVQTNSRGWVNLMPTGKTLTLTGPQYGKDKIEQDSTERYYTIDGSGKTIINGGIMRQYDNFTGTGEQNFDGNFQKRGTGVTVVDWVSQGTIPNPRFNDDLPVDPVTNPETIPDKATNYRGWTSVEGGNLHFAQNEDLPGDAELMGGVTSKGFLSTHGAVGVDSGVLGNTAFLGLFNNSANPLVAGSTPTEAPYFKLFNSLQGGSSIFNNYDHGGVMLMLGAGEYSQNLDFSTGDMLKLANMSLAAHEGGSSFTGTITPATFNRTFGNTTGIAVDASTFKLGGGNGTLTLPLNDKLLGANQLLVTNGGEVAIQGTHSFTGATRVVGEPTTSVEELAKGDRTDLSGSNSVASFEGISVYNGTKLTVTNLSNGGSNSSVGASSNAAGNLLIQGSTLKYVGPAQTTDRLFTIGTRGATIDASGGGALQFSNSGALGVDNAESRAGALDDGVNGNNNNEVFGIPTSTNAAAGGQVVFSTEDIVPGMRITEAIPVGTTVQYLVDDDSPLVVTEVLSPHALRVGEADLTADVVDGSAPNQWLGYSSGGLRFRSVQFGPAPARFLTLTGGNTGNNTIASTIGNAAAATLGITAEETTAGFGTVGIRKQGAGKWVLTGNNAYSGATNVEEGTLLVNGTHSGGGAYNVTGGGVELAADAVLGGTGSITGALTVSGTAFHKGSIAPGASVGTLNVTGNVTMGENSSLMIELLGATADKLAITGDLNLSALLNSVSVTGAGTGGNWLIATYTGALTGLFETVTSGYSLDYGTAGQIRLLASVVGLPGDYNNDHKVDAADYTVWRNNLGDANESDLNGNGDGGGVTSTDYTWWKQHYGDMNGSGGGGIGGGTVPEPSSLLLVGIALAGMGSFRRRR